MFKFEGWPTRCKFTIGKCLYLTISRAILIHVNPGWDESPLWFKSIGASRNRSHVIDTKMVTPPMINSEDLKIRGFHKNHWLSGYPHFRMVEPGETSISSATSLRAKGRFRMRARWLLANAGQKKSDRMKGQWWKTTWGWVKTLYPWWTSK